MLEKLAVIYPALDVYGRVSIGCDLVAKVYKIIDFFNFVVVSCVFAIFLSINLYSFCFVYIYIKSNLLCLTRSPVLLWIFLCRCTASKSLSSAKSGSSSDCWNVRDISLLA